MLLLLELDVMHSLAAVLSLAERRISTVFGFSEVFSPDSYHQRAAAPACRKLGGLHNACMCAIHTLLIFARLEIIAMRGTGGIKEGL
jgi:hypothetical protein